jgi:hypothetical protein
MGEPYLLPFSCSTAEGYKPRLMDPGGYKQVIHGADAVLSVGTDRKLRGMTAVALSLCGDTATSVKEDDVTLSSFQCVSSRH